MKLPRMPHRWDLSPKQAIRLQRRLAGRVRELPLRKPLRHVAGGDVSFTMDETRLIAGWVVWDLMAGEVVESVVTTRPIRFPYVPGLLSFREAPAMIAAARKLHVEPDVFMLDGQGLAHPRRFGLACHVGMLLDRPTLGCAKSRLCGEHGEPAATAGSACLLMHEGECVGSVLRTRDGTKPVFVSIGYRITLPEAVRVVLSCCTKYRLPEPTRLAHQLVTRWRAETGGSNERHSATRTASPPAQACT